MITTGPSKQTPNYSQVLLNLGPVITYHFLNSAEQVAPLN